MLVPAAFAALVPTATTDTGEPVSLLSTPVAAFTVKGAASSVMVLASAMAIGAVVSTTKVSVAGGRGAGGDIGVAVRIDRADGDGVRPIGERRGGREAPGAVRPDHGGAQGACAILDGDGAAWLTRAGEGRGAVVGVSDVVERDGGERVLLDGIGDRGGEVVQGVAGDQGSGQRAIGQRGDIHGGRPGAIGVERDGRGRDGEAVAGAVTHGQAGDRATGLNGAGKLGGGEDIDRADHVVVAAAVLDIDRGAGLRIDHEGVGAGGRGAGGDIGVAVRIDRADGDGVRPIGERRGGREAPGAVRPDHGGAQGACAILDGDGAAWLTRAGEGRGAVVGVSDVVERDGGERVLLDGIGDRGGEVVQGVAGDQGSGQRAIGQRGDIHGGRPGAIGVERDGRGRDGEAVAGAVTHGQAGDRATGLNGAGKLGGGEDIDRADHVVVAAAVLDIDRGSGLRIDHEGVGAGGRGAGGDIGVAVRIDRADGDGVRPIGERRGGREAPGAVRPDHGGAQGACAILDGDGAAWLTRAGEGRGAVVGVSDVVERDGGERVLLDGIGDRGGEVVQGVAGDQGSGQRAIGQRGDIHGGRPGAIGVERDGRGRDGEAVAGARHSRSGW